MTLTHKETAERVQEEHEHLKAEMARIFALIDIAYFLLFSPLFYKLAVDRMSHKPHFMHIRQ